MTEQMAATTSRLATLTSVIRTRHSDAMRREVHAGLPRDLSSRAEQAVIRLERIAERLEKAIS